MAITEIQSGGTPAPTVDKSGSSRKVSSQSLIAASVSISRSDAVVVETGSRPPAETKNQDIVQTNQLISVANLASEATEQVSSLVKNLASVVARAASDSASPKETKDLEGTAQVLVDEINVRVGDGQITSKGRGQNEEARVEIEARLGKTLDFLLPDGAKNALGIGNKISFPNKEAILDTLTRVQTARARIDSIRGAVQDTVGSLQKVVTEIDVARQNTKASETSVRDVDETLSLAEQTGISISTNPRNALGSLGGLSSRSLNLLE